MTISIGDYIIDVKEAFIIALLRTVIKRLPLRPPR